MSEWIVTAEQAGLRLDRVAAELSGATRHRIVLGIEAGEVRVDGRRAKKGQPLQPGQRLSVELSSLAPVPEPDRPLVVIHEDPAFIVLDKPAGWPTHPLRPGETGTLASAVVARYPECVAAGGSEREGGAAHRLDGPTSGLVCFARSRAVWDDLRSQFASRTVEKQYLALVAGAVYGAADLEAPIGVTGGGRMRVATDPDAVEMGEAREARTHVEVERRFPGWTLLACTIETGVTHQIRVHLAQQGTPVAGDDTYGGARPPGLHRLFLHATALGFDHPVTGRRMRFESPLPKELQRVVDELAGSVLSP